MESESSKKWHERSDIKKVNAFASGIEILFTHAVWEKMFGWCRAADSEMSAMGLVEKDGNTFRVYDMYMPEQECTSGSTEFKRDSLDQLMRMLHKKKIPQNVVRCWMHTHYNFSPFWSGTDVECIEGLTGFSGDWMLSIVINQAGDYKCRLDFMKPIRMAIDDLDVSVEYPRVRPNQEYIDEVKRKVSRPSFGGGFSWPGYDKDKDSKKDWRDYSGYGGYLPGYVAPQIESERTIRDYRGLVWDEASNDWVTPEKRDNGKKIIRVEDPKVIESVLDDSLVMVDGVALTREEAKELGYVVPSRGR